MSNFGGAWGASEEPKAACPTKYPQNDRPKWGEMGPFWDPSSSYDVASRKNKYNYMFIHTTFDYKYMCIHIYIYLSVYLSIDLSISI
jgi:hypothetical protein